MGQTATKLFFGSDDEPGIRRQGRQRVRYLDEVTGEQIDDADTIERIRSLAVPPAWTDVWIAADPWSHVQATGRDARGRKQFLYHAQLPPAADEAKFELLVPFGHALPDAPPAAGGRPAAARSSQERVLALWRSLLEDTFVRIGNEEYARTNGSFGLTTLRNRHVRSTARCAAPVPRQEREGARRRRWRSRLAVWCASARTCPARCCSSTSATATCHAPVRSSDVNDYLREVTGWRPRPRPSARGRRPCSRGRRAGRPAAEAVREDDASWREALRDGVVGAHNTPAVCRRSYIRRDHRPLPRPAACPTTGRGSARGHASCPRSADCCTSWSRSRATS